MAPHEDRERRARQLLGPQVRPDAGADQVPDARGHRRQPAEPRGDRPDPEAVQEGLLAADRAHEALLAAAGQRARSVRGLRSAGEGFYEDVPEFGGEHAGQLAAVRCGVHGWAVQAEGEQPV